MQRLSMPYFDTRNETNTGKGIRRYDKKKKNTCCVKKRENHTDTKKEREREERETHTKNVKREKPITNHHHRSRNRRNHIRPRDFRSQCACLHRRPIGWRFYWTSL